MTCRTKFVYFFANERKKRTSGVLRSHRRNPATKKERTLPALTRSIPQSSSWRCVAESNCSIRFCRPPHNRFVNAPFGFSGCKGKQKKWNCQIFLLLFLAARGNFGLRRLRPTLPVAAAAIAARVVGRTEYFIDVPSRISHGSGNHDGDNQVLSVHIGCEIT